MTLLSKVKFKILHLLSVATGIYHCRTPEVEMEEQRLICETWLTERPEGICAFARIHGVTYYRPGYFDLSRNEWS